MLLYSLLHLAGLRPRHRGAGKLPAMGEQNAGPSRVRAHSGRGDDHRPAGGRLRQRRGYGHRRGVPGRHLQQTRLQAGGPLTPTASSGTAISWRASAPRPPRWPAISDWASSSICTTTTASPSRVAPDLAFTEDVGNRFEAYGWQVLTVADGNDLEAIDAAIVAAKAEAARALVDQGAHGHRLR